MRISLNAECHAAVCLEMARGLREQLDTPHYTLGVSVMEIPEDPADWALEHRTSRKRAARALGLGYSFRAVERSEHEAEIFLINTSLPERQGRPMTEGYTKPPSFGPNPLLCEHHHVYTYGVFSPDDVLVAYMWLYRCGDLALVSSLLGHGDCLADDVMYLLFRGMVDAQAPLGGTLYYNRWDSGTEGLRYFKERLGFRKDDVEWIL